MPISRIGTVVFITAILVVNYFVFFRSDGEDAPPPLERKIHRVDPTPAQPAKPQAPAETPEAGTPGAEQRLAARLGRGQRVVDALKDLGLDDKEALRVVGAMEQVFDFRKAKVGDRLQVAVDDKGRVTEFELKASPTDVYVVRRDGENYAAVKQAVDLETQQVQVGCAIRGSFTASLVRCGYPAQLAASLVDALSWDVDFFTDVRDGDEVRAIVERVLVDGRFLKYGHVRAVEYAGKFAHSTVIHYTDPDGLAGSFDVEGRAVAGQFLRSPLVYARVSSGFTDRRLHPVLHRYQKHLAVDYAAPVGTPVWAVAGGTVTSVGRKGAAGNLVRIQHDNGYETVYAHLDRFAADLAVGQPVSQKDVIGYVGQTGRATGPHLHFAVKQNGRSVNPMQLRGRSTQVVAPQHERHFRALADEALRSLRAIEVLPIQDNNT